MAHRSLAAIALENAVEGCVRETYGALVAAWQAAHATDADLVAMYLRLADDEARHAALSWDLDAWLAPQLAPTDRDAVERARAAAIDALYTELDARPDPTLVRVAGLPDTAAMRRLLDGLRREVWRA